MSTCARPLARRTVSKAKQQRRNHRDHSATEYARLVGGVICNCLQRTLDKGTTRKGAVSAALKEAGFGDCTVEVIRGEIHAYIGSLSDKLHGHVIVQIRRVIVRYCRGYAMPRGPWNRCTYY